MSSEYLLLDLHPFRELKISLLETALSHDSNSLTHFTVHHSAAEAGTYPPLLKSMCCLVEGDFPLMCSSSIVLSVREGWVALSLSVTLKIK